MAPEYAMHGYLSVKTDVFSYGVLVLEIIGGRKNHDGQLGAEKADLLGYVSYLYGEFRCNFATKCPSIRKFKSLILWKMAVVTCTAHRSECQQPKRICCFLRI